MAIREGSQLSTALVPYVRRWFSCTCSEINCMKFWIVIYGVWWCGVWALTHGRRNLEDIYFFRFYFLIFSPSTNG